MGNAGSEPYATSFGWLTERKSIYTIASTWIWISEVYQNPNGFIQLRRGALRKIIKWETHVTCASFSRTSDTFFCWQNSQ